MTCIVTYWKCQLKWFIELSFKIFYILHGNRVEGFVCQTYNKTKTVKTLNPFKWLKLLLRSCTSSLKEYCALKICMRFALKIMTIFCWYYKLCGFSVKNTILMCKWAIIYCKANLQINLSGIKSLYLYLWKGVLGKSTRVRYKCIHSMRVSIVFANIYALKKITKTSRLIAAAYISAPKSNTE